MTMTLYHHSLSGHSHRVRLMLSLLGIEAQLVEMDLLAGAHKQADFLAKNPFGQVPVLEDNGVTLSDSNGILVYLASRYDESGSWYPEDSVTRAEVQRFLSVAAGQVAFGPAAARLVNVFGANLDHEGALSIANSLLKVLDAHLADRAWLVGESPTIADIANYAYLAHAPEGGVDLSTFPAVGKWLERIERLPGFVPMTSTAVGLAA